MSARLRSFIAASLLLPVLAASPLADAEPVRAAVPGPVDGARAIPGLVDWSGAQMAIAVQLWYSTVVWNNAVEADRVAHLPRPRQRPARARTGSSSGGSHRGYATAEECVANVENGGSYERGGNPTHAQKYQFSRPTWIAYGGNPDTWGHASAAEQEEVFERAWSSPGGPGNWLPYDGC